MEGFIYRITKAFKLHLNLIKTVYFNLKVFGVKKGIKLPIWLYGRIQLEGLHRGCIELTSLRSGTVKIGGGWYTEIYGFSKRHTSFLRVEGKLVFGNGVIMNQGVILSISSNAIVKIGNNVRFNERVTVHSKIGVSIGDNSRVGWNTQILDTSFHYMINKGKISYRDAPVFIDHNVWIANGVSIMKGVCLPAYTVVASNSLVNKSFKDIGEHCLIGGIPAKFITEGVERLLICESEVDKLFLSSDSVLNYEDIKEELLKDRYRKR